MTANESIITNRSENVLCAPNMALKFTPDVNGPKYKTQGLWILNNGKAKRFDIQTGAYNDNATEIISKEIKEGDKVIMSILSKNAKKSSMRVPRL